MSNHLRSQGIVGQVKADGHFVRQIFFPLTPELVEYIDEHGTEELYSGPPKVEFKVEDYLDKLPELEAEILYMLIVLRKAQKDVARLLDTSQPTVSYRYRRALDKLSYLFVLMAVNLKEMIQAVPQLNDQEKQILEALFFTVNQEMVGQKYGRRQSSVKWIFTKAKRYLQDLERKEPEKWWKHYCAFLLLERNLNIRIFA